MNQNPIKSINFFFQAEDGIRDRLVTGVQTCALPIFAGSFGRTDTVCSPACWISTRPRLTSLNWSQAPVGLALPVTFWPATSTTNSAASDTVAQLALTVNAPALGKRTFHEAHSFPL